MLGAVATWIGRIGWRRLIAIGASLAVSAAVCLGQASDRPDFSDEAKLRQYLTAVAERIQLPDKCGECHKSEFQVWEKTRHATQFEDLHTTDRAKKIYRALNLQLIRRATDERTPGCLVCHYTPQLTSDGLRAQISVGCESCHGPARDWISVHNNYGVKEADFQKGVKLESEPHKLQRIADSKAKGMRRPSEIYEVAANCFQCHTVPYEELVNRGGHSSGSDFELVASIQKIRHNFLRSVLTGDGKTNADTPPERKRIMYVVGRALAVEYSLRGIAVATKDDSYLSSMIDRNGYAVDALIEITTRVAIPEIQTMLDAFKTVALKANNRAALVAAADRVGAATKQFIARADPGTLASLDDLWNPGSAPIVKAATAPPAVAKSAVAPPPATPAPAPPPATPVAPSPGGSAPKAAPAAPSIAATTRPAPEPAKAAASGAASATPPAPSAPAPQPVSAGEPPRRPSWRPQPTHDVLQVPCGGTCHSLQTRWWRGDPHSKAVEPFRTGGAKQQKIAIAYGIGAGDINTGNQICMSCHGTVGSNAAASVRAGVGCQQCHGPGADYKEPHQKNRQQALAAGLVDLKNASTRSETCAGCHYVTEPRLIAAGHPTGEDFKIDARMVKIKHWGPDFEGQAVDIPGPQLVTSYAGVVAKRGPAPRAARAAVPAPFTTSGGPAPVAPSPPNAAPSSAAATSPEPAVGTGRDSAPPASPQPLPPETAGTRPGGSKGAVPGPVAAPPTKTGNSATVARGGTPTTSAAPPAAAAPVTGIQAQPPQGLTPFTFNPGDSIEEILLQLKARLESLYESTRGSGPR